MPAGSQFFVKARTADSQWIRIETPDGVSGWIDAKATGLTAEQLEQLPVATTLTRLTDTPAPTVPPTETPTATSTATADQTAGTHAHAWPHAATGDAYLARPTAPRSTPIRPVSADAAGDTALTSSSAPTTVT